jgi:tetratricopeptide (TPR) repeat protein
MHACRSSVLFVDWNGSLFVYITLALFLVHNRNHQYCLLPLLICSLFISACTKDERVIPEPSVIYANTDLAVKYVGSKVCASCHAEIYDTYSKSEMGRSMSKMEKANIVERFPQQGSVYDSTNNVHYQVVERNGRYYQREYRQDGKGKTTHERLVKIEYVMGSGNNLRMYFFEESGMLYEMPLTWYVHKQAWDFSPGYKEFGNLRFTRYARPRCIQCHNSYLRPSATANDRYEKPFTLGIGCERCHGPGELHVRERTGEKLNLPDSTRTIVNPRKLAPTEQLDVCRQCHLQGNAWVLRNESGWFDFRPGTKLETHRSVYFPSKTKKEVFEVADSPHRLSLSRCFKESNGALTCIGCHNPHFSIKTFSMEHYSARCMNCHKPETLPGKDAKHEHSPTDNCISCHMNRTGTDKTLHGVSNTDHWIRVDANKTDIDWTSLRKPLDQQPLIALSPDVDADDDGVELRRGMAYLDYHNDHDRRGAYLDSAIAYLRIGVGRRPYDGGGWFALGAAHLEKGASQDAAAALRRAVGADPEKDQAYSLLGKAYEMAGNITDALGQYRNSLKLKPKDPSYLEQLGSVLIKLGRWKEAIAALDSAIAIDQQSPSALYALGSVYAVELGNPAIGIEYFKRVLAIDPDMPNVHMNIGNCYAMMGDYAKAIREYKTEISLQPQSADVLANLGRVYELTGRKAEAKNAFEQSLKIDPGSRVAREYLRQIK